MERKLDPLCGVKGATKKQGTTLGIALGPLWYLCDDYRIVHEQAIGYEEDSDDNFLLIPTTRHTPSQMTPPFQRTVMTTTRRMNPNPNPNPWLFYTECLTRG